MRKILTLLSMTFSFVLQPIHWGTLVLWQSLQQIHIPQASAEVLASVDSVMKRVFQGSAEFITEKKTLSSKQVLDIETAADVTIDPHHDLPYYFIKAVKNGQVVGYGIDHIVNGKWGPIRYLLSVNPEGKIIDLSILEFSEQRGRPIARKRFTRQFIGKTIAQRLKIRKDIRGVSGASISSRGVTKGVRKSLHIFNLFYG